MKFPRIFLAAACVLILLSSCGTLTGIPGHGGGKRFAVEQELVSAATRAAVKRIDITALKGKNVNLFVNAIGDTGSGNLTEGRFSPVAILRGDTVHTPATTERSTYPRYNTETQSNTSTNSTSKSKTGASSTTTSSSSSSKTDSSSESTLAMPESKRTQQSGGGYVIQSGAEFKGLGAFHNSEEVTSNDLMYLTAIIQTYLFLNGVNVVPPSEATIDLYVTVDVFGTVRSRIEWFIANNEILVAKTSLEVMAVDHETGRLLLPPQSVGAEAEYNEQFIFWAGPVMVNKFMRETEPLLVDFSGLPSKNSVHEQNQVEQNVPLNFPFRNKFNKMWDKGEANSE